MDPNILRLKGQGFLCSTLSEAGADIDTAAGNGRTLAHWAAADRDGLDALRLLIQAGPSHDPSLDGPKP